MTFNELMKCFDQEENLDIKTVLEKNKSSDSETEIFLDNVKVNLEK